MNATDAIRAEIFIGRREGYSGPLRSVDEMLEYLGKLQKEESKEHDEYVFFVVHTASLIFIDESEKPVREPCIVLIADRSSSQQDKAESEWKKRVERYAEALAREFAQVKVHVSYLGVETRVVKND